MKKLIYLIFCGLPFLAQSADPKVSLIYGSWNPGEGGPVTTQPNPLKQPFGVDFDGKGNMYIVELKGGRVHRLAADNKLITIAGDGSKG